MCFLFWFRKVFILNSSFYGELSTLSHQQEILYPMLLHIPKFAIFEMISKEICTGYIKCNEPSKRSSLRGNKKLVWNVKVSSVNLNKWPAFITSCFEPKMIRYFTNWRMSREQEQKNTSVCYWLASQLQLFCQKQVKLFMKLQTRKYVECCTNGKSDTMVAMFKSNMKWKNHVDSYMFSLRHCC